MRAGVIHPDGRGVEKQDPGVGSSRRGALSYSQSRGNADGRSMASCGAFPDEEEWVQLHDGGRRSESEIEGEVSRESQAGFTVVSSKNKLLLVSAGCSRPVIIHRGDALCEHGFWCNMGETTLKRHREKTQLKDWHCVYKLRRLMWCSQLLTVTQEVQYLFSSHTQTGTLHWAVSMFRWTQPNGCHASSCITV